MTVAFAVGWGVGALSATLLLILRAAVRRQS